MTALKKTLIFLLCAAGLLGLSACGKTSKSEKQIFAMDTVMTLTAYGEKAEAGLESAAGIINAMDAMLDPENNDSVVYELNNAMGKSVVVKGQVAEMLSVAQTIFDRSGGALDLAIYPLVKLWGFVDGKYYVPTEEEVEAMLPYTRYKNIAVQDFTQAGSYLVTVPAGTQLSFAAVAKGCASSYAIAALRSAGVESACISLGGNVQTLGTKPDGTTWNIAVQDPNDTSSYVGILTVGETAVVTSGGYQRYFDDKAGNRYHHILDPNTGYPADSGLLSVTIVCPDGIMADALSTAMFIQGADKALSYWRTYGGFEAVLVTTDGRVIITNGLYEDFTPSTDKYTYEYAN